jgi:hypothetical protein
MKALQIYIEGIGVLGPAMPDWKAAIEILRDESQLFVPAAVKLPAPEMLPASERRRAGDAIKLSMAVGLAAIRDTGIDDMQLASVFSSTGGDCENCHSILEALASNDRLISPTRFHNSVHNAPAGYWSIATQCTAASTSLCAYDATFCAGLLEVATQAINSGERCLLVAFDTAYPEPLYSQRPIPYPFALGFVINSRKTAQCKASLTISLSRDAVDGLRDEQLELLRQCIPAARSLPLLKLLAAQTPGRVVLDYLDPHNLAIEVNA